jgi:2-dehydro-3-deoxygluconokinase
MTLSTATNPTELLARHLVSLGECLVEFNRRDDGAWTTAFAGDTFNTLFYAARLGLRTGFVSTVGNDLFTSMILSGIEREGIDTAQLRRSTDRPNGLYFIELDRDGEYTFHFWRENSAATGTLGNHDRDELLAYISDSRFLLLSGITLAVMRDRKALIDLLENLPETTMVVFDTNYRARLWQSTGQYRERLEEILRFTDIFLPSRSDLHTMYPGASVEEILRQLGIRDIARTILKAGSDGCGIWHEGTLRMLPPEREVRVVDCTGAGDAFNAGILAGIVRGYDEVDMCRLAQRTAERALGARGALDHSFENIADIRA